MTLQLLMLTWIALSAAGLAAAVGMLVHAWAADEFPAGPTRAAPPAFSAPR